jgi:hypothetical protein
MRSSYTTSLVDDNILRNSHITSLIEDLEAALDCLTDRAPTEQCDMNAIAALEETIDFLSEFKA